jgi:hypothetical protein
MSKVIAKLLGEEFILLESNEMVTILQTGSLFTSELHPQLQKPQSPPAWAAPFHPLSKHGVKFEGSKLRQI